MHAHFFLLMSSLASQPAINPLSFVNVKNEILIGFNEISKTSFFKEYMSDGMWDVQMWMESRNGFINKFSIQTISLRIPNFHVA